MLDHVLDREQRARSFIDKNYALGCRFNRWPSPMLRARVQQSVQQAGQAGFTITQPS